VAGRWAISRSCFHPGVWFKNFALPSLGSATRTRWRSTSSVDTDAAKPALLHAPAGERLARVPYDRSSLETPYEERTVAEETHSQTSRDRWPPITAGWNFEPMLPAFWREVMQQPAARLSWESVSRPRGGALERRWGVSSVKCR